MADPTTIWLLAGEASGDVLGARLMQALRAQRPGLVFAGIGGPRMEQAGLASLFPMRDLAVMGLAEILPRLRALNRRLAQAVADIEQRRPDLVVTIDSPGFTLRLLARIKPLGLKRIHYVAPQVWAWREHRVRDYPGLAAIARRLIRVPHVAMVNLLAGRAVVPELLQEDCTPEKLSAVLATLLTDTQAAGAQRGAFSGVMHSLHAPSGTPSEAAASALLDLLDQP